MTGSTGTKHLVVIYGSGRQPGTGLMTGFTHICGIDMCGRFTGRQTAIMTGTARLTRRVVMIKNSNVPIQCRVAGVAGQGCWNMHSTFTRGANPIMTTGTSAEDFIVINGDDRIPDRKLCRCVTGFAGTGGINMRGTFTRSAYSIVTSGAGANDLIVIDG